MNEALASFPTKTGRCYLYADRLVLAREGVAGTTAQAVADNGIARLLLRYGGVATYLLYTAYTNWHEDNYSSAGLLAIGGLGLLCGIRRSLGNSAAPVIDRAAVQRIAYQLARPGLTRAYFTIYVQEAGRLRKHFILLPGSLSGGHAIAPKALAALNTAGFSVE